MRLLELRSTARSVSSRFVAFALGASLLLASVSAFAAGPPPGDGEPKPLPWKGKSSIVQPVDDVRSLG